MPPKKKVAGDAGKGEKVFKNLCAVCHSFAVRYIMRLLTNLPIVTRNWSQPLWCCWFSRRLQGRIRILVSDCVK